MGLLDGKTHKEYYQNNDFGNYQFVSLDDIITQFEVAYVGENKIIPKIKRADIAFHAMRALAELSFDTFKSVKSYQIDLPPTLLMPLPHDYVNYTKLSWTDSSGIKHPLYPTSQTSNPFQISQHDDGSYDFSFVTSNVGILENSDFSTTLTPAWTIATPATVLNSAHKGGMAIDNGALKTSFHTRNGGGGYNNVSVHAAWQAIDVSGVDYLDISATGIADTVIMDADATTNHTHHIDHDNDPATPTVSTTHTHTNVVSTTPNRGLLRFGLSSNVPSSVTNNIVNNAGAGVSPNNLTPNFGTDLFNLTTYDGEDSYIEWNGPTTVGSTTSDEEVLNIDVSGQDTVYAVIISTLNAVLPSSDTYTRGNRLAGAVLANSIDNVVVTQTEDSTSLIPKAGNERNSSTWNSYKGNSPSENNNDDYEDNTYWHMTGKRYGLDPQHAQANGSFYIDDRLGRIHFSSNISGKTVILDYISDSLGTDAEMQVHKFAEDAMYKWIAHAILSTSSYGQGVARSFQRDKFAAVRKAKLRLSNIKLEELTQILRGKSKQIKH